MNALSRFIALTLLASILSTALAKPPDGWPTQPWQGDGSSWVLTSVIPGCTVPPCDRQVIGRVVSFLFPEIVVVETTVADHDILLWIGFPNDIWMNRNLVFDNADCNPNADGKTYATDPGPWWYREVLLATGPDLNSAIPLVQDPGSEPNHGPWRGRIEFRPEHPWFGWACMEIDEAFPAYPVTQIGEDLYTIYPRAPEPWRLEHQ